MWQCKKRCAPPFNFIIPLIYFGTLNSRFRTWARERHSSLHPSAALSFEWPIFCVWVCWSKNSTNWSKRMKWIKKKNERKQHKTHQRERRWKKDSTWGIKCFRNISILCKSVQVRWLVKNIPFCVFKFRHSSVRSALICLHCCALCRTRLPIARIFISIFTWTSTKSAATTTSGTAIWSERSMA